ncbi:hypothetical protein HTZ85_00150 [Escherichia coli]|nr:hypothetical protein [Escherichia coli]
MDYSLALYLSLESDNRARNGHATLAKDEVDRLDSMGIAKHGYITMINPCAQGLTGSTWGCYSDTQKKWIPLDVSHGGTGANSLDDAKTNLQIPEGGLTKAMTLNALVVQWMANTTLS